MFDDIDTLSEIAAAIALTVSGWIITMKMRSRMQRSLGRKASDLELASLNTWMKVEEAEQREKESGAIHPR
jgi:hypothetical protein